MSLAAGKRRHREHAKASFHRFLLVFCYAMEWQWSEICIVSGSFNNLTRQVLHPSVLNFIGVKDNKRKNLINLTHSQD
jgi:hypothetical protein